MDINKIDKKYKRRDKKKQKKMKVDSASIKQLERVIYEKR